MNIERRDFFKILSAGVVTAAGAKPAVAREWQHKGRNSDAPAILYDATLCIGCKACEVGCKKANKLNVEHSSLDKWHGVEQVWDSKEDLSTNSYLKIKLYKDGTGAIKDQEKNDASHGI